MKKFFLTLVAAFLTLSSVAFAAQDCPPGSSCSENYILTPTNVGVVAKPEPIVEKKGPTKEEVAAYQKQIDEASIRDNDLIKVFTRKSLSDNCYAPTDDFYRWLIGNKDVVVDKKEVLPPTYYTWNNNRSTGCMVVMVIHYHKKK